MDDFLDDKTKKKVKELEDEELPELGRTKKNLSELRKMEKEFLDKVKHASGDGKRGTGRSKG